MQSVKSLLSRALIFLTLLASLGFGVLLVGFAVAMGTVVALAFKLTNPSIASESADETAASVTEGQTGTTNPIPA